MKLQKDNKYIYKVDNGTVSGYFNIYQARSGHIMLMMGKGVTQLTERQVMELNIDVYSLMDFDYDDYLKAYSLVPIEQ
jgi:hypothetical protein